MRTFVDVGAHYGETLDFALNPKWGFDRVYALEPSAHCLKVLERYRDPRLTIEPFGLSNRSGDAILHGAGLLGGSVYADKRQLTDQLANEEIRLVRATDWFAKLPKGEIYLKLNCEGSEVDVLGDLLDSGEIRKVHRLYVHFDIEKVAGQERRRAEIERRLQQAGVHYRDASTFGFLPEHRTGEAWLERHCPQVPTTYLQRLSYDLPRSPYDFGVSVLRAILPERLFWWIGARFGRIRRSRPSGSQSL